MQREIHGNLEWLCKGEDIILGMYCPEEKTSRRISIVYKAVGL